MLGFPVRWAIFEDRPYNHYGLNALEHGVTTVATRQTYGCGAGGVSSSGRIFKKSCTSWQREIFGGRLRRERKYSARVACLVSVVFWLSSHLGAERDLITDRQMKWFTCIVFLLNQATLWCELVAQTLFCNNIFCLPHWKVQRKYSFSHNIPHKKIICRTETQTQKNPKQEDICTLNDMQIEKVLTLRVRHFSWNRNESDMLEMKQVFPLLRKSDT